jgi:hypothetical protein
MNNHQLKKLAAICLVALTAFVSSCKDNITGNTPISSEVDKTYASQDVAASTPTSGQVYTIPVGGITNHANKLTQNSIAWYFDQYGGGTVASPNTFILSESAIYLTSSPLTMPANAILKDNTGVTAEIKANFTGNEVLLVKDHCQVYNLGVNGNFTAQPVVKLDSGAAGVRMTGVAMQASRILADTTKFTYVLYALGVTDFIVDYCTVRRAGCTDTQTNFKRKAQGIGLLSGNNITVKRSNIAYTASSGIAIGTATNVTIDHDTIFFTGRAIQPEYTSDCVTSYHNGQGSIVRNVYITNNYLHDSMNHGVHVSGRGFHILWNKFQNNGSNPITPGGTNVYVGDQRSPAECSWDIEINNNNFVNKPVNGTYTIHRSEYKGPFYVSGNTGVTTPVYDDHLAPYNQLDCQ